MSADVQDMMAKLQVQLSTMNNQPSFGGLQAPLPQSQLANALNALKQQNNTAQMLQPTQGFGGYGALHDAGKQGFVNAGASLGNMIGNALGAAPGQQQPQQAPPPASAGDPSQGGGDPSQASSAPPPPGTPQYAQWYTQKIMQAKQITNSLIQSGKDPASAQMAGLQYLVGQGVNGASDELVKLQSTQLKNQEAQSSTYKNNQQGDAAADEIKNRAKVDELNAQKSTWRTVSGNPADPNDTHPIIQVNGAGEVKVDQKVGSSQQALANLTPDAMGAMIQSYKTTGQVPQGIGRSPAVAGAFWDAVAKDSAATGDTASAVQANKLSLKANGAALDQTQKQLSQTQSYFQTMDKNIAKANELAKQIDFGDATKLNEAYATWRKGTSDPTYAKYNVFFDSVANEYAKIKSGSLGNAPVSDSARHEAMSVLLPTMSSQGVQAAFDAVKQEGQNRLDSLQQQRDMLLAKIKGGPQATGAAPAPQSPPGAPAPPGAGAPKALNYNPATGKFE